MLDRSGHTIREYNLIEKVGEGEFAAVYKAQDIHLDRTVAIKIIHQRHMRQRESMLRFKSEAGIIAHLNHPFIVRLYTFWMDDDGAYIAMQWMPGGSLEQHLKRNRQVSLKNVNDMLQKIAPALSAVHRQHIIHRDLKPANIMLDLEGNAYVADFGLAKWHTKPSDLSSPDASIGTPAYMPPEQVESSGDNISGSADIYSLGVILYQLLAGQHPFGENLNMIEMVLHQLRDPLPSILDVVPHLPEAIDTVVQKATQKNPKERYQDVLELADAFQDALGDSSQPSATTTNLFNRDGIVPPRGNIHAHIYKQAGAVLEKPRKLVGRDELVAKILQELTEDARILLHGLGGMGKTAIAATVSAHYLEQSGTSVIWIELGKQDEDTFFDAIAQSLGHHSAMAGKYGDERILVIREILLEQDAVLVIDNIWNEQAMIPIMRAIPYSIPTLLTSRKLLSIDGMLIDVEPLAADDALKLLEHHANKSYLDDHAASQLVDLLGSHPYAIEIVGSRLKIYPYLTPDKLSADISDAPHETGRLGQITKPTIKDLLNESISELSDHLRHLLTMMGGLFTTYASLALFAKVVNQELDSLINDLAELERNGLIRLNFDDTDLPYYRIHDLTYSYLYFLFIQTENRHPIINATRAFLHDNVEHYDMLELDLMNILGAARSARQLGDGDSLIDIMRQLVVEAEYLTARQTSQLAVDLTRSAIQQSTNSDDDESAHYLSAKLGNVYFQITEQFELAVEMYTQAFRHAQMMGDKSRQAICLSLIATARFKAGLDKVEDYFERATQVALDADDAEASAKIYNHRSYYVLAKQPPDYHTAREFCNEAIIIARKHNLTDILISTLMNRSLCETELGLLDKALESDLEAYQHAINLDSHTWIVKCTESLAYDYQELDDSINAEYYLNLAFNLALEIGEYSEITDLQEFAQANNYSITNNHISI